MSIFKMRQSGNNIQVINPFVSGNTSITENPIILESPPNIVDSVTKQSRFIEEDEIVNIPPGVKEIFISLVGGGGAGGLGIIKDGIAFSGGGGGAGNGFREIPIKITDNSTVSVDCKIGKGGYDVLPVGGETSVTIIVNGDKYVCLTGGGGEPGGSGCVNIGGIGGKLNGQNIYAKKGSKGSVSIPSYPPLGGSGGVSLFADGGKGTSYNTRDLSESNGKWGSGGGGKIPTFAYEKSTKGGDGFVIIDYV